MFLFLFLSFTYKPINTIDHPLSITSNQIQNKEETHSKKQIEIQYGRNHEQDW